jgi:hypothetical protein
LWWVLRREIEIRRRNLNCPTRALWLDSPTKERLTRLWLSQAGNTNSELTVEPCLGKSSAVMDA